MLSFGQGGVVLLAVGMVLRIEIVAPGQAAANQFEVHDVAMLLDHLDCGDAVLVPPANLCLHLSANVMARVHLSQRFLTTLRPAKTPMAVDWHDLPGKRLSLLVGERPRT